MTKISSLTAPAIIPSTIRNKPSIHLCRPVETGEDGCDTHANEECDANGDRGDVLQLLRCLWSQGADCIIDVRVTETDKSFYRRKDPMIIIAQQELEKKK